MFFNARITMSTNANMAARPVRFSRTPRKDENVIGILDERGKAGHAERHQIKPQDLPAIERDVVP